MLNKDSSIFRLEKKLVFLINFLLVLMIITFFLFNIDLEFFFYFNVLLTLILSYIFFKRSKKLSKILIVTNMFIFFYFLYPQVAKYLSEFFGAKSYIFILFYSILLSYLFLYFSGNHNTFIGNIKKFSFKLFFIIMLLGISFGTLFFYVGEPVPQYFVDITQYGSLFDFVIFIIFSSFILSLGEQMIFSGFLFNSYNQISSKQDAFFQAAIIFVCFHLLRFEILIKYYFVSFGDWYLVPVLIYYVLLFIFMISALYLYSFKYKNYEGNFLYPVFLHFITDLTLFSLYALAALS